MGGLTQHHVQQDFLLRDLQPLAKGLHVGGHQPRGIPGQGQTNVRAAQHVLGQGASAVPSWAPNMLPPRLRKIWSELPSMPLICSGRCSCIEEVIA